MVFTVKQMIPRNEELQTVLRGEWMQSPYGETDVAVKTFDYSDIKKKKKKKTFTWLLTLDISDYNQNSMNFFSIFFLHKEV